MTNRTLGLFILSVLILSTLNFGQLHSIIITYIFYFKWKIYKRTYLPTYTNDVNNTHLAPHTFDKNLPCKLFIVSHITPIIKILAKVQSIAYRT